MSKIALLDKSNNILSIVTTGSRIERMDLIPPIRIDGVTSGWVSPDGNYRVVSVTDFVNTSTRPVTGSPSYAWDGTSGTVKESYNLYFYTSTDVDIERDRRIELGFTYNGNTFQSRSEDRENIAGASQLATLALMNGANSGNYLWDGTGNNFTWITSNNQIINMDVYDVINLGKAAAEMKKILIYKSRYIKDNLASNTALDIYNNTLWS